MSPAFYIWELQCRLKKLHEAGTVQTSPLDVLLHDFRPGDKTYIKNCPRACYTRPALEGPFQGLVTTQI